MPRMTPALRAFAYKLCKDRDGERCTDCNKHPVKAGQNISDPKSQCKRLDVDHVDGDKDNNPPDGSNWALRCHPCNCRKDSRGRQKQPKFGSYLKLKLSHDKQIGVEGLRVQTMEMAKNLQAEHEFHRFVDTQIKRLGSIKKRVLLDAAANDFRLKSPNNIGQLALSRYLDKRTNPINGDLEEYRDVEEELAVRIRT